MKKEGKSILKIMCTLFLFLGIFLPKYTFADLATGMGVEALTSGIKYSTYEVVWCSPHAGGNGGLNSYDSRFSSGNPCQSGNFQNVSNVGLIGFTGATFRNGNVSSKIEANPTSTRVTGEGYIDLFSVPSIKIQAEGTFTINVYLQDYAGNINKASYTYKVDKTAPQFKLTGITSQPKYTYAPGRITSLSGTVVKYDSNTDISDDPDLYDDPFIEKYVGDDPISRSGHNRQNLYSVYFQNSTSGIGAYQPFNLNVAYSDTYESYLSNYIAGTKPTYEVIPEGSTTSIASGTLGSVIPLNTSIFSSQAPNSQKKYKIRIYDNTTTKTASDKSNYSEIVFYAVRDNTPPNMGGNGLATTEKDAVKEVVKFDTNTPAWDEKANISDPTVSGAVSKFISANSSQSIFTRISDNGITGNGQTTGTTAADKYEWYNAGVAKNNGITLKFEKSGVVGSYDPFSPYTDRFKNEKTIHHDFSKVDNNRKYGQRKYATDYETVFPGGSIENGVCDLVGNCIYPALSFRVVAGVLSTEKSKIKVGIGTGMLSTGKVFADGNDLYSVKSEDYDSYGNSIVGVTATDNSTSPVIKKVSSTFNFINGLNVDQRTDTPTGAKLAVLNDSQTDNASTSSDNINTATPAYITFEENADTAAGNMNAGKYSYTLTSKVPTVGLYPYLSDHSRLKVVSVNPKAEIGSVTNVEYYPITNSAKALGIFNTNAAFGSGLSMIDYNNKLLLGTSDYKNDLNISEKDNYGDIIVNNPSGLMYKEFGSYMLGLEYASPLVYGGSGFTLQHLINNIGQTNIHNKIALKLGGVAISNTSLYEKYLPSYQNTSVALKKYTPNIFNIHSAFSSFTGVTFENAKINTGKTLQFSFVTGNTWNYVYKTKSSVIKDNYSMSGKEFNMGYISYISYNIAGNTVYLPSISRNVSDSTKTNETEYSSRYYFPENKAYSEGTTYTENVGAGDYQITGDPIKSVGIQTGMGIAVTGLSNSKNLMLSDDSAGQKANINVGENLTRYDLIVTFKKNIAANGKKWCSGITTINENDLNDPTSSSLKDCTLTVGKEVVSFIKGNINIQCSGTPGTCRLKDGLKRVIIVQDGSTYIKSDISTFGRNARLLLGTVADKGLNNISISTEDNPSLTRDEKIYGWTLVDPMVTNIDAFVVSQGPLISYDGNVFNNPDQTQLKNQLHIYGSLLSLNTTGGYKANGTSKCPYIISSTSCDSKTAFIFDLVTLRRYSLEGVSVGSMYLQPSGNGLRSGKWNNGLLATASGGIVQLSEGDVCDPSTEKLRCVADKDYIIYTMFLEKDPVWNSPPSVMFGNNK